MYISRWKGLYKDAIIVASYILAVRIIYKGNLLLELEYSAIAGVVKFMLSLRFIIK
jgi:hypothetical protein